MSHTNFSFEAPNRVFWCVIFQKTRVFKIHIVSLTISSVRYVAIYQLVGTNTKLDRCFSGGNFMVLVIHKNSLRGLSVLLPWKVCRKGPFQRTFSKDLSKGTKLCHIKSGQRALGPHFFLSSCPSRTRELKATISRKLPGVHINHYHVCPLIKMRIYVRARACLRADFKHAGTGIRSTAGSTPGHQHEIIDKQ